MRHRDTLSEAMRLREPILRSATVKGNGCEELGDEGDERGQDPQIDIKGSVRYKVFMQTLSLTEARANLTKLCQSALDGMDVAIVHNGRLVKLQPIDEVAELSDGEALPETDKLLASRAKKTGRPLTAADRKRILAPAKR